MVEIASITVAVISLVASFGVAVATGILTIYSEERKARHETERLLRKYRDPLLLAAYDLQSRIYNITESSLLSYLHGSQDQRDCLVIFTAFLFGQYLCWTQILRQQAQFACFATEERGRNKQLVDLLGKVQNCLNTDRWGLPEEPFMLWKGQQLAIGELMVVSKTVADGKSELFCMGFAEFTRKWKAGGRSESTTHSEAEKDHLLQGSGDENEVFRGWFGYIERGIYEVDRQQQHGHSTGLNRIRRLQHMLLELVEFLDPEGVRVRDTKGVTAAPDCACTCCQSALPKARVTNV